MFDHYIITRFNLRNPKWDAENNGKTLLTDTWMEDRFKLFENFCLPTVQSQSNQNFTWLLYFDVSTKPVFKEYINKLVENSTNIKIQFIDGMPLFYESLQGYISKNSKDKKHIITTRLDNDDSIHIDFIKRIQEQFRAQKRHVIDIINGYILQVKPEMILAKKNHIFNPFISLIEENKDPKTIWSKSHNIWKVEKNVTFLKNERLWMVVIHQDNKTNDFNGFGNISWKKLKEVFKISTEVSNDIENKQLDFNQWKNRSYKNMIFAKYAVFSKFFKRKIGLYKFKNN